MSLPGEGRGPDVLVKGALFESGPRPSPGWRLKAASNLSDVGSASTARTNLGLGGAATLSVGTTTGTVAAGDDSRITGAAQKSSNLSDIGNAATAFGNIKQAATTSASGAVELATAAEAGTGTDTARAVTPAGLFPAQADVASGSTCNIGAATTSQVNITGTPIGDWSGWIISAIFLSETGERITQTIVSRRAPPR